MQQLGRMAKEKSCCSNVVSSSASASLGRHHWARGAPLHSTVGPHSRRLPPGDRLVMHSLRQPKDPKAFKDMDALRSHLESEGTGFISGTINFISEASFGSYGLNQPWWTPASLYRQITRGLRPPEGSTLDDYIEDPNDPMTSAITATHELLGPLLLISRNSMRRMARRYPGVLSMPATEVASRLMDVREALPGCDACLLLEQYPQVFLSGDARERRSELVAAADKLRAGLKGARINEVIMWDPEVLFMDLDYGLAELRDLWDVDEQAMAASEPRHLATAIRALCNTKKTVSHGDLSTTTNISMH